MATGAIQLHPATAERFDDFVQVMTPKGGSGGCWCMLWRLDAKGFPAGKGDGHRDAIRRVFESDTPPGVLGYVDGIAVGWCSVAPRGAFPRLRTSRVLKPVDDAEVWSVSCLMVVKGHRRQGVSVALLDAAAAFVAERGGTIVEGYPVEPEVTSYPAVYAWTGTAAAFRRAGFVEVTRRSATRPIMRRLLKDG